MKKTIIFMMLFAILAISGYSKLQNGHSQMTQAVILSDGQMAMIQGEGCSFWEWLATSAAVIACAATPMVWECIAAFGGILDCLSQIGDGGGPGSTPSEPCPGGGSPEDPVNCAQSSGRDLGPVAIGSGICCDYGY